MNCMEKANISQLIFYCVPYIPDLETRGFRVLWITRE